MSTPITTTPTDLAALTAAAERAKAQAAQASAAASAAHAEAQLAAERIRAEQDVRFVVWAEKRLGESPATLATLADAVDTARKSFEAAVSAGGDDIVALYLGWTEAAGRLYHERNFTNNLKGHLHHRRPEKHAALDASRGVTHDSRSMIPDFPDALARAVSLAAAARSGDVEDQLQRELESALRGEDPVTPDRRGA